MSWLDALGWFGSALLVFSIMQARVLRFRILNSIACVILTVFNGILGIWPMVAMNVVLTLINLWFIAKLLRERRDEVLPFARHFLREFSERFGSRFDDIHPAAAEILQSAPWRGNIRELRHTIERIVLIEQGPVVLPEHVAFLRRNGAPPPPTVAEPAPSYGPSPAEAPLPEQGMDIEETMHRLIERALEKNNYNQSRTARYLNITREALRYRLKKGSPELPAPPRARP